MSYLEVNLLLEVKKIYATYFDPHKSFGLTKIFYGNH